MVENITARVCPLLHYAKKDDYSRILAISSPTGQSQNYKRLAQVIQGRQLIKRLKILEESRIRDNLAISMLFNLQNLEVAV